MAAFNKLAVAFRYISFFPIIFNLNIEKMKKILDKVYYIVYSECGYIY